MVIIFPGEGMDASLNPLQLIISLEGNVISTPSKMEVIGSSSNADQNDSSGSSHDASKKNLTGKEAFVNHAEMAWNQMRTEWVGCQSKKLQRPPKGSTICLTASYDDILLSKEHFQPPIPLAVMVGYLVKVWQEEDL